MEYQRRDQSDPLTLTPMPDLKTYHAEEWKDVVGFGMDQIEPIYHENHWYNLPLSEAKV